MLYLAIDTGGSSLKSAIVDSEGNIFEHTTYSVNSNSDGSKEEILEAFRKTIYNGLEHCKSMGFSGRVGIAMPGPFDIPNAIPLMKHKFKSIYGLNFRESLQRVCSVPNDLQIDFIHDVHAVLEGELWQGNASGYNNVAVVTLGTGLGFAISENGKILKNKLGGPLISLYSRPYRDGILEDFTAKRGCINIYKEISGNKAIDGIRVSDIGTWADEGDPSSIQTFYEVGRVLSESLQDLIEERDIQCLLFGGQISKSFKHMQPVLEKKLYPLDCLQKISLVKSIDNAALIGAVRGLFEK